MNKPILVYRGKYVESTHNIHIAVVNKEGRLLYSYGNPNRMTFPRSSMKPFQAIPLLETGAADTYSYSNAEIAIACASHAGESFHRETILQLLERLGIKEDHLQCGTHTPWNLTSYKELLRNGGDVTPVYSNCSGKHTGMLATAIHMKEDIANYREVEHPHQQRILEAIEEICDFPKEKINLSVDGCGVPVHQLPLYHVALGYARLASPDSIKSEKRIKIVKRIRDSMMEFPEMVGGTSRFDTDLMNAYQGRIVSKAGAEAVQCMGLVKEGIGIAIKVEDGGTRAVNVAAMEVLSQLGYKEEGIFTDLEKYVHTPVLNARKEKIGEIRANFNLERAYQLKNNDTKE
ncbi:asparaginase [Niallia sp. HCP3S3_B10]|uniref:asparaginase n=1 Tax=Niallia sp. HCP3S3_B10 TaxID=3438944 RepID=UPI003F88E30F